MRLLFVSSLYPPVTIGGFELRCAETAAALRRRGHEVWVLTTALTARVPEGGPEGEDRVLRKLEVDSDPDYYRPWDYMSRPRRRRRNRRELAAALEAAKPDLVVVWGMWNLSRWIPIWAERELPGRVAYLVADYWPIEEEGSERYWRLPAGRRWLRAPKRWLGRWLGATSGNGSAPRPRFEHVRCCSGFLRSHLVEHGGLPASAEVIVPGVEPAAFAGLPEPDWAAPTWRLLYVGRLAEEKGVADAIEAMALLPALAPARRFHLTLLGGGGHPTVRRDLERRVASLGLEGQVTFAGAVPRDQVAQWLGRCEVFLFPSVWGEPLGRAPLEAMAAGRLVIGTTVGGMKEVLVDGVTALTFPPGDSGALARSIALASSDPGSCRRLAETGRRTVLDRFTLERYLDELETWLTGLSVERREPAVSRRA